MSPEIQTIVALAIVAVTTIWLVRRALRKDPAHGCGSSGACGAVSPEVRKLRSRPNRARPRAGLRH
jgi:hypothetical protein